MPPGGAAPGGPGAPGGAPPVVPGPPLPMGGQVGGVPGAPGGAGPAAPPFGGPPGGFPAPPPEPTRWVPKGWGILWSVGEDRKDDGGKRQVGARGGPGVGEDIIFLVPLPAKKER